MMTEQEVRFWTKVERTDGCWEWSGRRFRLGYGQTWWNGKTTSAHRIAYELLVGPIPEGLELDHTCRNRACVNPAHLEPVTHQENMRRAYPLRSHCPQGHPYDEANTYRPPNRDTYVCRRCSAEARRRYEGRQLLREAT